MISPASRFGRSGWARYLSFLALASVGLASLPRLWFGVGADALYHGDLGAQRALADDVAGYIEGPASVIDLNDPRFEGEWMLVSYQMAILGLGQVVHQHPELRSRYVPAMRRAAKRMMRPRMRAFATRAWGSDALERLETNRGDAWLGWPNLALSMLASVDPDNPLANVNRRITRALARRLGRAPHAVIRTYPGESYPTDVAACAASIALHDRAMGTDHGDLLRRWAREFAQRYVDRESGYLWQQADPGTGVGRDAPRGSGTAVTAYFLSFVDADLSRRLTEALARHERSFLGFGAVREYPEGFDGPGDIDSGPVVAGVSVTATAFTLGAARANHRPALFERPLRTARFFGVEAPHEGGRRFAAGGFFGNALLLAQITAEQSADQGAEP